MIGETVAHYQILEKLGEGGMGVVYKALDTKLERLVALKFLPAELTTDAEARDRFVREARAASALDHPNICAIHEVSEIDDGRIFICMSLADGGSLEERLRDGPMSLDEAAAVALGISRALSAAHERGIVHRDVKPANVLFTRDGQVKLADFGLAKLLGNPAITRLGVTSGTAAYMSPEQARCEEVDHRTDIWSLGVVLHEMLAGKRPFESEYEQAILYSVCNEPPAPLALARPDAPASLVEIVETCLEKDPGDRYQTADEIRSALSPLGDGTARVRRRSRGRGARSVALPLSVAGVAVLAAALALRPAGRAMIEGWIFSRSLPAERYVAVVPLATDAPDDESRALAAGLAEHVALRLGRLNSPAGGLHILPAADLAANDVTTPSDAAERLGANLVLTGDVTRTPERVSARLVLLPARGSRALGTSEIEDLVGNLSSLQEELVTKAVSLVAPEAAAPLETGLEGGTTVPAAFDAYVTGLGHLRLAEDDARIAEAIAQLRTAVALDPNFAVARSALARAYWRRCIATKDTVWEGRALRSSARATDICASLAEPHVTAGLVFMSRGDYEEAARSFERATAAEECCLLARLELAEALERSGDAPRAELTYRRLIEDAPAYWNGRYSLGNFYYRNGRFEEAVAEFEATTEIAPGNALAQRNLGAACYHLERWNEARDALLRSIEIHPTYGAYSNLATLYFQQSRYADAAATYEKAVELRSDDYRVWGNLATACSWLPGKEDRAREAYGRAIEEAERERRIAPKDPGLLAVLAGYYASVGRPEEALHLLERAVELARDDPEVLFQAGHSYELLGEREQALELICRALALGYSRAQIEATPGLRAFCTDERYRAAARNAPGTI